MATTKTTPRTTKVTKVLNIYEKLSNIQNELKAPKNQYNDFGKYNYRNCEDILEALKPLCMKYKATLIITDVIQMINERYYIAAHATLFDWESDNKIEVKAYARECESKKGMDEAQITGATSSYARKYALNGLFSIDDTKDADSQDNTKQQVKKQPIKQATKQPIQQAVKQPVNNAPLPEEPQGQSHIDWEVANKAYKETKEETVKPATQEQLGVIKVFIDDLGKEKVISKLFKGTDLKKYSFDELNIVIDDLQKLRTN